MNVAQEHQQMSISIQQLYILIKRYFILIISAGLVGGVITYCICSFMITPVYEASAKMIVNSKQEQTGSVTNDQITSAQKLIDTYSIVICSQAVLKPVIENLNLPMDVETLAKRITVSSVNDTQVMQISVQSKNPDQALQIVDQIVSICPTVIIDAVEAGSVKTIEPAHLKKNPVSPNTNLFTVIAAFLCMVTAVIIVILRFLMDNTYKSDIDLRNDLDLPVLGVIPDYDCCLSQKNEGKEAKYHG